MRVRPVRGGRVVVVTDRMARALIRAGKYVAVDVEPETAPHEPEPFRKPRKYRRRDMKAED